MGWKEKYIDAKGLERVAEAVKKEELKTSGEIITVVAESSTLPGVLGLFLGLLIFLFFEVQGVPEFFVFYLGEYSYLYYLIAIPSLGLGVLLARLHVVQRLCLPRSLQARSVDHRALLEFYLASGKKTKGGTAVLIFVSLMEHRAVVIADDGISSKLPPHIWNEVVGLVLAKVKKRDLAGGLIDAVHRCGELLGPYFPPEAINENELADQVIMKK
jgi:putative membrane protein